MIPIYEADRLDPAALLSRDIQAEEDVSAAVDAILRDVRARGDAAVRAYTEQFNGVALDRFEVTREEIDAAWDSLDGDFRETLRLSADNIRRFHETQVRRDTVLTDRPGVVLGQRYTPIEKVGICVPGSPAAFPSTILMNVIPAKIAGVREIVVVTPPDRDGAVSPEALAAARIAGADRVFKIGGAQAVAALAYGTETVPAVDKIVGPGGIFVATAKRKVFGRVAIDMIAGPSEILVLSDGNTDPAWAAADLLSQAEHDVRSTAVLVTDSRPLAEAVQREVERQLADLPRQSVARRAIEDNGKILVTRDLKEAAAAADRIRPGASGAVRGGPLRPAAPDPQRRQRLSGAVRPGGPGGLLRGAQPHPAHVRHCPLLQSPERGRLCEEDPVHLLQPGGAGPGRAPDRGLRRAGGPPRPRPLRPDPHENERRVTP